MALGKQTFGLNLSFGTLSRRVDCLRYTLLSFSVFSSILGIVVFALCIWLKSDQSFHRWIEDLEIFEFYIGIYIILFGSCFIIFTSCLSCLFIANENVNGLRSMSIVYLLKYACGLIGAAVLLNYSTNNSAIQPVIRKSMLQLISQSQNDSRAHTLRLIQESIGCCGADGANDYLESRKPLPPECRDSVTGHTYFHGCVDELTWFLEEKASWLAGVTMFLCFFDVSFVIQDE
ncbi:hypothetical protein RUM44_007539 [Polyplax serrata]|uniref:Tetraspanin n=1 Tax=Polyplax serrata TaxID=468196 RepID=A0ABR1B7X7_POLSC